MREIEECTAEVFRRSENRLRERRRNRNRVLAVCIPVCLIAAVWSAMGLPAMIPSMESRGNDRYTQEAAGNAPSLEDPACPSSAAIIQAAVVSQEDCREVTGREAAEMHDAVLTLFAEAGSGGQGANGNLPAEENSKYQDWAESTGKAEGYTITFTAEDGSKAVYRLSGNTFADVETNETVFLSDTQAAGLLTVLGLAE